MQKGLRSAKLTERVDHLLNLMSDLFFLLIFASGRFVVFLGDELFDSFEVINEDLSTRFLIVMYSSSFFKQLKIFPIC